MIDRPFTLTLLCAFLIAPITRADKLEEHQDHRARTIDQAIVGDTAVLLEHGEFEVTFGTSVEDDGDQETVELFVQFEYGVTDWFELGMQLPYLFLFPESNEMDEIDGLGDMTLSFSWAVPTKLPLMISASLEVSLSTGNESKSSDFSEGKEIWMPSLTIDLPTGDAELVIDIGGEFAKHNSVFVCEVTLAYPMDDIVTSVGFDASLDGDEKELFFVPGIGFPIAEDIEIGIELPVGLNRYSSDWQINMELTFEF